MVDSASLRPITRFFSFWGGFNSCLIFAMIGLFGLWFLALTLESLSPCRCGNYSSFLFYDTLFPQNIPYEQLIITLAIFAFINVVEWAIWLMIWGVNMNLLSLAVLQPKLLFYTLGKSTCGLMFLFCLMAQPQYVFVYFALMLILSPLFVMQYKMKGLSSLSHQHQSHTDQFSEVDYNLTLRLIWTLFALFYVISLIALLPTMIVFFPSAIAFNPLVVLSPPIFIYALGGYLLAKSAGTIFKQ